MSLTHPVELCVCGVCVCVKHLHKKRPLLHHEAHHFWVSCLNAIGSLPGLREEACAMSNSFKYEYPHRLLDVESSESKLYLIFEFCDSDLKKYMNNIRGNLSAKLVKVPLSINFFPSCTLPALGKFWDVSERHV